MNMLRVWGGGIYGDSHLWDVWHLRQPAKYYEKQATPFFSEFGMQSYSSPQVAATYCSPDRNIQGPEMENHQKNAEGNKIIFDYRQPFDLDHLSTHSKKRGAGEPCFPPKTLSPRILNPPL
jgi:beta-galactosidase/beta-glucuronidase